MEKYQLKNDVTVFGFEVKTFPDGIGEAFDKLVKKVPEGFSRDYYGISFLNSENRMVYLATALEKEHGEAEKYQCDRYTIKKGDYVAETVWDWQEDGFDKIRFQKIVQFYSGYSHRTVY